MKSIKIFIIIIAILSFGISSSNAEEFDHLSKDYDKLLQYSVKDRLVDYKAIKANPAVLNNYLDTLSKVDEPSFNTWSEKEKLTYLINLGSR